MEKKPLQSNGLLLVAAAIWGFAFVAQRAGMEHVGPFTFNAVRFALGSAALAAFIFVFKLDLGQQSKKEVQTNPFSIIWGGIMAGTALFLGASFQQFGLIYTTAGKAGFITGLYVIIVPILGLLWRHRTGLGTWLGAICAVFGMYFLSLGGSEQMQFGDLLVLLGAFFWAGHVHVIGWQSRQLCATHLALGQFITNTVFSTIAAFVTETVLWSGVWAAAVPILYAGLLSVSVAYTLQVVGQREADPAQAAIILSLESVFAVLGGWLLLDEILSGRTAFGCLLMLFGIVVSQLKQPRFPFSRKQHRPAHP